MPSTTEFKFGDRVVHSSRPEWGTGVVTSATSVTENGKTYQRLSLRFDRAGLKTLSTEFAALRLADEAGGLPARGEEAPAAKVNGSGWLETLEAGDLNAAMARLPEETRDPFTTMGERIKATLSLYRFTDHGAPLLDWAAMQTGLRDPLTRFNRHELEQFFRRFAVERDQHLKRLLLEAKKNPPPELPDLVAKAPKEARDAMRRLHIG